jgi:hypothetical protein
LLVILAITFASKGFESIFIDRGSVLAVFFDRRRWQKIYPVELVEVLLVNFKKGSLVKNV